MLFLYIVANTFALHKKKPKRKFIDESEVYQSCLILSDPIDCSVPGSSVHGIFQARVLEWVSIAFFVIIASYMYIYIWICFIKAQT